MMNDFNKLKYKYNLFMCLNLIIIEIYKKIVVYLVVLHFFNQSKSLLSFFIFNIYLIINNISEYKIILTQQN